MLSPVSSAAAPHTTPAKPEPQTLPCTEQLAFVNKQHDLPAGIGSGCVLPLHWSSSCPQIAWLSIGHAHVHQAFCLSMAQGMQSMAHAQRQHLPASACQASAEHGRSARQHSQASGCRAALYRACTRRQLSLLARGGLCPAWPSTVRQYSRGSACLSELLRCPPSASVPA